MNSFSPDVTLVADIALWTPAEYLIVTPPYKLQRARAASTMVITNLASSNPVIHCIYFHLIYGSQSLGSHP
jgi:hypothetical protein